MYFQKTVACKIKHLFHKAPLQNLQIESKISTFISRISKYFMISKGDKILIFVEMINILKNHKNILNCKNLFLIVGSTDFLQFLLNVTNKIFL